MKTRTVSTEVAEVLGTSTMEGNALRLPAQLDRKLYVAVNKVLEAAGGKWNRKHKAHIFEGAAADVVDPNILTGEFTLPADFGQFDSPPDVVARLIEAACLEPGMLVLEPSAGVGNIVRAIMTAGALPHVFEIDPKRVEKLQALFVENAAYAAAVLNPRGLFPTGTTDFLTIPPPTAPSFDRVIMNPPFAKQADIAHVRHAARFLKPGGRLVAVMSAGAGFRTDRKTSEFRDYVYGLGGDIKELPPDSFKAAGTGVRTVLVHFDA